MHRVDNLYDAFVRSISAPGNSEKIEVRLDAKRNTVAPPHHVYHTYFVASRKTPSISMQSVPFLLYSAISTIRGIRGQQMHPSTSMAAYGVWEDVAVFEVFGLFIIARLCLEHGPEAMHLTPADWRIFSGSLDKTTYKEMQHDVALQLLRQGDLVARTAQLILSHVDAGERTDLPKEAELERHIEGALDWVEGFFRMNAGTHTVEAPAISMRSLAKPPSPYEPMDRQLASQV